MITIFPSLISADLLNLEKTIRMLDPYCAGYHLDIMDDHFVPNLTWGHQFANAISRITSKQLWIHLMVDKPEMMMSRLILPPNSIVSFHLETKKNKNELLVHIREKKWLASIAINPKTDLKNIFPFLNMIDQVLIMSVEPGFSGQEFIPSSMTRLAMLNEYRHAKQLSFTIGMDGGINESTLALLCHTGVDSIAIASAIFENHDPLEQLKKLQALTKRSPA